MKTAGTIRMNYQAMLRKAATLEELAGQLNRVAASIDHQTGMLSTSWTGDASAEYRKKLTRERDLARRRASQLKQSAQGVRSAAKRIYDAEMFSLSLLHGF
ncbi:MAG: WXG100 family type VII secretion target [Eubacteriales bacterium]|nr:WXG100 family type VII secretion target [Eubacteriales bacterium]